MPVVFALTCAQCSAPLPPLTQARGHFTCGHCGAQTLVALSPDELALFTNGLAAETGSNGAFTLSGLGQQLSEQFAALHADVQRSLRLAERAQLPQLEEQLRQAGARLADLLQRRSDADLLLMQRRRQAINLRTWRLLVGLGIVALAFVSEPLWPLAVGGPVVIWALASFTATARRIRHAQESLHAEAAPEIERLQSTLSETNRLIAELRGSAGQPASVSPPPRLTPNPR